MMKELRYLPPRFDPGERRGRPVVTRRRVRRRRVERPPATLTCDQVGALVDACANARDRFVVEALYATGLRAAELCGLHLSDLHLLPSAVRLGCPVAGAHLHVVRREDNENGALAKSVYPRVVPVCQPLVWCHDAYRLERDNLVEAAASDYLLVNLWRPPLGRGLRPAAVDELFARLSGKAGTAGVTSVLDYDLRCLDADGNHDYGRFARFTTDRVHLAYGDAGAERGKDTWDLRVFGRSGHLDFTPIRQGWLREVARAWAGAALVRVRRSPSCSTACNPSSCSPGCWPAGRVAGRTRLRSAAPTPSGSCCGSARPRPAPAGPAALAGPPASSRIWRSSAGRPATLDYSRTWGRPSPSAAATGAPG